MDNKYTQQVTKQYSYQSDTPIMWETIENMDDKDSAAVWKQKILSIAEDFCFSSRYALIRILHHRYANKKLSVSNSEDSQSFDYALNNGVFHFQNISISEAKDMPQDILSQYHSVCIDIASHQTDYDSALASSLVTKCLRLAPDKGQLGKANTLLSRQEAFALAHVLGFSAEELQWFLLRICDIEDGINFKSSHDLIDLYCLAMSKGYAFAESMKQKYEERYGDIDKAPNDQDLYQEDFTAELEFTFLDMVYEWKQHPEDADSKFMAYLKEIAPYLDTVSHAAQRIYRNLAVFAYDLIAHTVQYWSRHAYSEDLIPLFNEIVQIAGEPELLEQTSARLFCNGIPSEAQCREVAEKLTFENSQLNFTNQLDAKKAWHVITAESTGKPTASGGINASRTRLADILLGKEAPVKADLLYLIWFIANMFWSAEDAVSDNIVYDRLDNFISTARRCLKLALLPDFYLPHLLEQSLLLAIVSSDTSQHSPAETYEYFCSLLREHKTPVPKIHYSKEYKLELVNYCLDHSEETVKSCAEKFHVNYKSLSSWVNSYTKNGKL